MNLESKNIFTDRSRILVTCPKRVSGILRAELEQLDFPIVSEGITGVVTEGTMQDAMRLNLLVRTGHRVLYQLHKFYVRSPDDLHKSLTKLPWEEIIPDDGYVSVISSVDTASINNSQFANVKCKDAIVDRIRNKNGQRPDSGSETNKAVVFLYWKEVECYVYLDTSGEALSMRGYRKMPWKAPMRETLAAATLLASKWDAASPFVNPMCGSGTIAIEAALLALGKPVGSTRTNFGFMHLVGYDARVWKAVLEAHTKPLPETLPFPIIATDISDEAVYAARENARVAGVEKYISFDVCDIAETPVPLLSEGANTNGVVMLNPEYGIRMGDADELEAMYKRIGDFFKQRCQGYMGYIFTGNLEVAKRIGLKAKRRIEFYNAEIDCRLLEYELYAGTRRTDKPVVASDAAIEEVLP
jgi:23S rRNA G2445 N2-methylase RlmL